MREPPFSLFAPFAGRVAVSVFAHEEMDDATAAAAMGAKEYVSLWQVHGAETIVARLPVHRDAQADGAATDVPSLALITRWADCQNFVIYAPEHHVLGVLHAGWRGLIAGAIPEHIRLLKEEWEIDPKELYVAAGPSLCQPCAGFSDPAKELGVDAKYIDGKNVDLRRIADDQFRDAGVLPENFERSEECTQCDPESFWTYRGGHKELVQAGRSNLLVAVLR
jgi:YfiH family protein